MNLQYKILWIDDDREFIDSFDTEALTSYVEAQGFDLEIELRTSPEEISKSVDGTHFDLLIIDYNIAEEKENVHGSDVIKQVRDQDCLTEVIFYSQTSVPGLRQIAANSELEGVFFSGRDQLSRKIEDVFELTIRKVGIVMSGVADLDHLVVDVIRAVHDKLESAEQTGLRKRLLEKMRPAVKHVRTLVIDQEHAHFVELEKLLDEVIAFDPADFDTLVTARSFDSSRRVDMAVSLCKEHPHLQPYKKAISELKAVLLWRNALAHQRPKRIDNGFPIFEPEHGKEESFDNARTLALRKELRANRVTLQALLKAVNESR
jgi:CheY-like chemotaxis protein